MGESNARVQIGNMRTGDIVTAQFNPAELERKVGVAYTQLEVLGLSYQPLQYKFRPNETLKFTLHFDARSIDSGDQKDVERYLDALTLPTIERKDIAGGGPPDVLFLWPGLLTMRCRVTEITYKYKQFAPTIGERIHFSTDISVVEARDTPLYAEDVLRVGLQRF